MLRSLTHFWPIHLAVILGAAVATAVLSGALFVGDSVRGSLRELTLDRLGGVESGLLASRFFREELAGPPLSAAPAIVARGSVTLAGSGSRAARVAIYGVDERFLDLYGLDGDLPLDRAEGRPFPAVAINESLRRELGCRQGDAVVLSFGRWSEVPRDSLLGDRDPDAVLGSLRVEISRVLPDRGLGRFGLVPTQQQPLTAFVALPRLQRALGARGQVNALFHGASAESADLALGAAVRLEDLGLRFQDAGDYFSIDSDEYVLRPEIDDAIGRLAGDLGLPFQRTQSYLANTVQVGERQSPYALVAALDPRDDLGWASLTLAGGAAAPVPGPDGILLGEWIARDLAAGVGDRVDLTYFVVGPAETLHEERTTLRVEGVVRAAGLGADRTLTPDFPGIHDADDISDWDPPFPVDLKRIRPEDEAYWDARGATPKAFVSEATGRRLWSTRYGSTTAVRVGVPDPSELVAVREAFVGELGRRISPARVGFSFRPLKQEGLRAASGTTDFSQLFVAFSFFLIVSAGTLVGLLFRLGAEQRAGEVGLKLAVGYTVARVRRSLLLEGTLLAAVGGLLGLAGGLGYAWVLMAALRTLWRPAVGSSELFLHVRPVTPAIGWTIAMAVVVLSIALALRKLVSIPPPQLLRGATRSAGRAGRSRLTRPLAYGGLVAALAMMGLAWASANTASPGLTFGIGASLLVSGLAFFSLWCRGSRSRLLVPRAGALVGMAARNSSWNPGRSVLSLSLVASACFVIVLVATQHTDPARGLEARDSGAGGFALVAEADVPLHHDLDRSDDRLDLGFSDRDSRLLEAARVFQLRLRPGDDTSCLNLFRPEQPRLLGVPPALVERGGFRFKQTAALPPGVSNPWELLEGPLEPGVVAAFADANSAQWILKVGLGQDMTIKDGNGDPLRLRLVGLFENSLFQSELLVSETAFLRHFPDNSGTAYFLIDTPTAGAADVAAVLESTLAPFGFDATTTADRIASFKVVENTYLSTFQVLGGLGLLLGTVGLGVVLARNVLERRGELATLRAFGFRRSRLAGLVFAENLFLLVSGMALGTSSALAASALRLAALPVPWLSLAGTLGVVLFVGLLAGVVAVAGALRVPLVATLKSER